MDTAAKRLGKNLRDIRLENGLSQAHLAESVGVAKSYISNIENGKINLTLSTMEKIAKKLKIQPKDLLR